MIIMATWPIKKFIYNIPFLLLNTTVRYYNPHVANDEPEPQSPPTFSLNYRN